MRKETLKKTILDELLRFNDKTKLGYRLYISDPKVVTDYIMEICNNIKVDHIKRIEIDTTVKYPIEHLYDFPHSKVRLAIFFNHNTNIDSCVFIEVIYVVKEV